MYVIIKITISVRDICGTDLKSIERCLVKTFNHFYLLYCEYLNSKDKELGRELSSINEGKPSRNRVYMMPRFNRMV